MTQTQTQKCDRETVTAEQVEDYLARYPAFFSDHLDLLEKMTVPHPSGAAVSLVTKLIEVLRNKNRELQRKLNNLVEIARDNDNLSSHMHQLTLALLDASTLEETLAGLEYVLHEYFLVDFVALRIIKNEPTASIGNLFIAPDDHGLEYFRKTLTADRPKCGHPTHSQAKFLFGKAAREVLSCAIMPIRCGDAAGILAIGSRQEDRFHHSMGHLFLNRMSAIVGTRLKMFLDSRP